jgi:hypothetical protein
MNINITKTKEMLIGKANGIPELFYADRPTCGFIERVTVFKLLGVHFNSNLNWNDHVSSVCSKANFRLYFLKHLKRYGIDTDDLLCFYTTTFVPILEYCCPVWHTSFTLEQSDHIESSQKRAFSIIFGFLHEICPLTFVEQTIFLLWLSDVSFIAESSSKIQSVHLPDSCFVGYLTRWIKTLLLN